MICSKNEIIKFQLLAFSANILPDLALNKPLFLFDLMIFITSVFEDDGRYNSITYAEGNFIMKKKANYLQF